MSTWMKLFLAAGVASALKVGSEQMVEPADTEQREYKIEIRGALNSGGAEKIKQIQEEIPSIMGAPEPLQYYTYGKIGAMKMLLDVNLGQLPADGKLGFAPAGGSENGQEFVIIHDVLPDSHSAKHGLGLFTGAFVIAINHQPVRDHKSYHEMRDALQPGQEVVYTLCPSIDGYRADYLPAEAVSAAEQSQPAASEMKVDWQPRSTWKFILELTRIMKVPNDQEVLDFIQKLEMDRVTDTDIVFQRWKSFFAAHDMHDVDDFDLEDLVVDYQGGIGMIQKGGDHVHQYGHMILPPADAKFDDETLAHYKSIASPWVFELWQSYKCDDVPDSKISGDDDLATEDQKSESNAVPLEIQVGLISGETHLIKCLSTDTVKTTKNKIRAAAHIVENMKVDLFDSAQAKMADESTLAECGVVDGAELSAVVSEKFHPQPGPDDLYEGEGPVAVAARCPGCKHVDLRYHLEQADSMFEQVGTSRKCRCHPPIIRCNDCQTEFVYESGNGRRSMGYGCPMLNGVELKEEYVKNLDCWKEKYPSPEDEPKPREPECNIQ